MIRPVSVLLQTLSSTALTGYCYLCPGGYSGRAKGVEPSAVQECHHQVRTQPHCRLRKEIGAMSEAIGLPKVVSDIAKQLYKKIEDSKH